MLPCRIGLLHSLSPSLFDSLSVCFPHSLLVTGPGLFCRGLAEATDGKSAGEAANTSCLPESERVNLRRGHNGVSLAKPPHTQAACHQPCSCPMTPFCVPLSSPRLHVWPKLLLASTQLRRLIPCGRWCVSRKCFYLMFSFSVLHTVIPECCH